MFDTYSQVVSGGVKKSLAGKVSETAVLVGVYLSNKGGGDATLDELYNLAAAANICVVDRVIQVRAKPESATYIGSGKLSELKGIVESGGADLVIFDNDLAPSQTKNLEDELKVKVIDRTELILDIFASRARTSEAKLAVELAQLEYSLPRLKKMWTHLERQGVGGVGLRGPGEKQLEVDRRLAQKRINILRDELDEIHRRRKREVLGRSDRCTVSLVGYTNAGKSTLMNVLTDSDVFVKDMLFATLDTRTRRWNLSGWGPVLLSDTVGFVRDLPHHLVASFRATLEETLSADLLLHVADASSVRLREEVDAVYCVLEDLGIREKDMLLVLNKVDVPEVGERLYNLSQDYPNAIQVSAKSGFGLDRLSAAVSDALSKEFIELTVEMSVGNGRMLALLAKDGEVLSKRFTDEVVCVSCRVPKSVFGKLQREPDIKITCNQNYDTEPEKW
ncbi:MAG: GTPase HflX [Planctomycetaceae bacterium]|jgi:GTP-binding protein HflX|nr:GTPase HflX [Planctomycetaceae bacterium]